MKTVEPKQTIEQFFEKHNWLLGQSEIKRAFAIWGYTLLAGLLFYIGLFVIVFVLSMIAGTVSSVF